MNHDLDIRINLMKAEIREIKQNIARLELDISEILKLKERLNHPALPDEHNDIELNKLINDIIIRQNKSAK